MTEISPSVAQIWRYPVKSFQGEALDQVEVTSSGFFGDRGFGLRSVTTGKILSAKRWGKLLEAKSALKGDRLEILIPTGDTDYRGDVIEIGRGSDPAIDSKLSEWFGEPVELVTATNGEGASYETDVDPLDLNSGTMDFPCPPGTFLDAAAVHILATTSLADAAQLSPDLSWDVRRFRPSLVIDTSGTDLDFVDETWIGRELSIGTCGLVVFAPTVRCAMPTRAQPRHLEHEPLGVEKAVLRTLAESHHTCLGVYAAVARPGEIHLGDRVWVGEPN